MEDHNSGMRYAPGGKEKRAAERDVTVAKPHLFLVDIRIGHGRRTTAKKQDSCDSGANNSHVEASAATLKPLLTAGEQGGADRRLSGFAISASTNGQSPYD
jgi:hypothetical protein